jgi:hypothetical protein
MKKHLKSSENGKKMTLKKPVITGENKKRNMQDTPISYYQALKRQVVALEKRVKKLEKKK